MTDIEKKSLALLNEVAARLGITALYEAHPHELANALCRAIEQHEAFRREVSDAVREWYGDTVPGCFQPFIIAKPVDPLVEVLDECGFGVSSNAADDIRAALAARGLKIVEVGE